MYLVTIRRLVSFDAMNDFNILRLKQIPGCSLYKTRTNKLQWTALVKHTLRKTLITQVFKSSFVFRRTETAFEIRSTVFGHMPRWCIINAIFTTGIIQIPSKQLMFYSYHGSGNNCANIYS